MRKPPPSAGDMAAYEPADLPDRYWLGLSLAILTLMVVLGVTFVGIFWVWATS